MSRLTDWIEAQATPEPSQPITGIPVRQRRRQKEDPITVCLCWMALLLSLAVVVAQVGKWMGW